jgi:hypothetical protein
MNLMKLRKWIKIYKKGSLVLGFIIPIVCFLMLPDVSLLEDPLSRFGIEPRTQTLWIIFNQLMSIALLVMGRSANEGFSGIKRRILDGLLIFSCMNFALSGFITMDMHIPHLTLATLFFLGYCAYMFWFGRFSKLSVSLICTILVLFPSLTIAITPFLGISYGLFEVVFILSVVIFNALLVSGKISKI